VVRDEVTQKLARLLRGDVRTGDADRRAASVDNLKLSVLPDAVIRPADEEDVEQTLRLANRHRVPITVRGAGSATTGATTPLHQGWVLDFADWTECTIDPVAGIATVESGVTVKALQDAAAKLGWLYPPDPSSAAYATIGGTIATNAGGLRGAQYGVTRDYVLGLKGFLPTGEPATFGGAVKKYVSGFNLRDLWIGSEGCLGVVTRAWLKLIPQPAARQTCLAAFPDEDAAIDAVEGILAKRILPAVLEFLDRETVLCVERQWKRPVVPDQPNAALLLIEIDGHPAEVEDTMRRLKTWAREADVPFQVARDADEVERLWKVRRSCSKAMFQLGPDKLNEDVVVPLAGYRPLLTFVRDLRASIGLPMPTFGHAGDGNFHVHIMYDRRNEADRQAAEEGIRRLFEKVVELGGAITGEHGIGLAKSAFLELQHTQPEIAAMQAIKTALDPNGILNPGKIFTPFPVWNHPRADIALPWDH
jgi:glycolate oxidase